MGQGPSLLCGGQICLLGSTCYGGSICGPSTCDRGYTINPTTGVCVNLQVDSANCGAINNACPTSYAHGGAGSCQGGICTTTCNAGYGFDAKNQVCTPTTGNLNNCGAVGNSCQIQHAASQTCPTGTCLASACVYGYIPSADGTSCVAIDINTNVNNCGALNKPCAVQGASTQQCVGGQCQATACVSGLTLSSNGACIDLNTNVNNCGALNKPCAVQGASTQQCVGGQCQATACVSGLTLSSNGACLNLNTNVNNCGALNNACAVNGATSQYCSGGRCYAYACSSGLTLSPSGTCLDLSTSRENCGAIGLTCSATYKNGGAGSCVNGHCFATCNTGFVFDTQYNFCRPYDLLNCGAIGRQCSIVQASQQACVGGICKATLCVSGYTPSLDATACVLVASGRARTKRAVNPQHKALCPAGETACPIAGSTSFHSVRAQLSSSDLHTLQHLAAAGGYECLDTDTSLESCGGCASTGEGRDCTAIPHVGSTGCREAVCVILSCAPDHRRSLAGDRCLPLNKKKTLRREWENSTTSEIRHRHTSKRSRFPLLGDGARKHP